MPTIPESLKEFINIAGISAKIKALEVELAALKAYRGTLGGKTKGRTPGKASKKRAKRGNVKGSILAYLQKNNQGKAIEIAKLSGLKVTSVNQSLFAMKKQGVVSQDKKRGSPFVLVKK